MDILFNDALSTFYLWLYGISHMVMDHSDNEMKPAAITTWELFLIITIKNMLGASLNKEFYSNM